MENPSLFTWWFPLGKSISSPGIFFHGQPGNGQRNQSETRNHSNQRQLILHQKEIQFFSGKLTLYGKHHQFFEVRSFNMNSTYHSRYKWAIHSFCAIFNRFSSSKHSPAGSFSAAEPWGACEVQWIDVWFLVEISRGKSQRILLYAYGECRCRWCSPCANHGAGIFTYKTGCFLGQMLVNIPAPWSIWVDICRL